MIVIHAIRVADSSPTPAPIARKIALSSMIVGDVRRATARTTTQADKHCVMTNNEWMTPPSVRQQVRKSNVVLFEIIYLSESFDDYLQVISSCANGGCNAHN